MESLYIKMRFISYIFTCELDIIECNRCFDCSVFSPFLNRCFALLSAVQQWYDPYLYIYNIVYIYFLFFLLNIII